MKRQKNSSSTPIIDTPLGEKDQMKTLLDVLQIDETTPVLGISLFGTGHLIILESLNPTYGPTSYLVHLNLYPEIYLFIWSSLLAWKSKD